MEGHHYALLSDIVDYKKILQLIQESPERVGEEKLHLYQFTNTSLNSLFHAKPTRSFQMYNMRFSIVPLLAVITAASSPHGWPLPGFNTWGTHFFRVHLPPPPLSTCTINLLPPAWLPSLQPQVSLYPVQPNLPSFPHQNHICNCESESLAIAVDAANSAAATSSPSGDKDTPTVDTTTTATDTTATYYGDTTTSSGDTTTSSGETTTASGETTISSGDSTTFSGDARASFGAAITSSSDTTTSSGDTTTSSGNATTFSKLTAIPSDFTTLPTPTTRPLCEDGEECVCRKVEKDQKASNWENFLYGGLAGIGVMLILIVICLLLFMFMRKRMANCSVPEITQICPPWPWCSRCCTAATNGTP